MLQLPSYIIIKNNNNKKKETYIVHIPYKYVHIGITNYENMIRMTNWQEFTKKKLRMSER